MTQEAKTIARLMPEVYDDFTKQFLTLRVNEQTTLLQAGVALGREEVLRKLREQLVVQRA